MEKVKTIVEISGIKYDAASGDTHFNFSQIDQFADGSAKVTGFSEGMKVVHPEMSADEVIAYMRGRCDENISDIVLSETQTVGEPNTGFVPAPSSQEEPQEKTEAPVETEEAVASSEEAA